MSRSRTFVAKVIPASGQVDLKRTLRLFTIVYVVQAGVGIVTGITYAIWLLYW